MDLKLASERAYEIAVKRGQYKYDSQDTMRGLKHCAGEIIEANEAYNNWSLLDTPKDDLKEKYMICLFREKLQFRTFLRLCLSETVMQY